MIFKLPHSHSAPHPATKRPARSFAYPRRCQLSGCTHYLGLSNDVRQWFEEMGIEYDIGGCDMWGEGIAGELFELIIPNDAHALIFKLRWL